MNTKIPRYVVTKKDDNGRMYELLDPVRYVSIRYAKAVSVPSGYRSDGASGALDIRSLGWWVHDVLCDRGTFDDGTPCTNIQASNVLADILRDEGRWVRAAYWWVATFAFGGGKARDNGMW